MVTIDWRRCPAPMMTPDLVADYGPFSADVGTRQFPRVNGEPYNPAPDLLDPSGPNALDTAGEIPLCWIAAGVMAWMAFGKKGR